MDKIGGAAIVSAQVELKQISGEESWEGDDSVVIVSFVWDIQMQTPFHLLSVLVWSP